MIRDANDGMGHAWILGKTRIRILNILPVGGYAPTGPARHRLLRRRSPNTVEVAPLASGPRIQKYSWCQAMRLPPARIALCPAASRSSDLGRVPAPLQLIPTAARLSPPIDARCDRSNRYYRSQTFRCAPQRSLKLEASSGTVLATRRHPERIVLAPSRLRSTSLSARPMRVRRYAANSGASRLRNARQSLSVRLASSAISSRRLSPWAASFSSRASRSSCKAGRRSSSAAVSSARRIS